MKTIIVAFIFAFGLMVSLPSTSSGSCQPPGQISFVVEQSYITPVFVVDQAPAFFVINQLAPVVRMASVQEKGGRVIVRSSNIFVLHEMLQQSFINRSTETKLHKTKRHSLICHNLLNYNAHRFSRDRFPQA